MEKNSRIFVAGHKGLVGSAICLYLKEKGYENVLVRNRSELNLLNSEEVSEFFLKEKPDYVFLAAAKVGGIHANNTYPVEFLTENIMIEMNVLKASYENPVKKLLFLGSSCIYPRNCPQPMKEEYLLTGELEPTNNAYAIAKIAGIILAQSYNKQYKTQFISCMPTNLYGINDNFHPENSHVLPALVRRFLEAKENNLSEVNVWGTGSPKREFLYSEDLAEACVFLMNNYQGNEIVNIGTGTDVSIKELVEIIGEETGFKGNIKWDSSKPDGTPRKLLDVSKINQLGWKAKTKLKDGIKKTIEWYLKSEQKRL